MLFLSVVVFSLVNVSEVIGREGCWVFFTSRDLLEGSQTTCTMSSIKLYSAPLLILQQMWLYPVIVTVTVCSVTVPTRFVQEGSSLVGGHTPTIVALNFNKPPLLSVCPQTCTVSASASSSVQSITSPRPGILRKRAHDATLVAYYYFLFNFFLQFPNFIIISNVGNCYYYLVICLFRSLFCLYLALQGMVI